MRVLGIETSCDETGVAVYDTAVGGAAGLRAHAVYSQIALHGLVLAHRREHWHRAAQHGGQVQLKQDRRMGQIPRLPPARMQFTQMPDHLSVKHHLRAAAWVQRRVLGRLKPHGQGREQGLYITLDVEEIHASVFDTPLQAGCTPIGQPGHAHRLVKTLDSAVAADGRRIAQEHTTHFEHTHAIRAAVGIELEHLQQRTQKARRRIGSALPASSRSQRSSTKLKLMVSW